MASRSTRTATLVADRENSRVQVFDRQGAFKREWLGAKARGRVFAVAVDGGGSMFVSVRRASRGQRYELPPRAFEISRANAPEAVVLIGAEFHVPRPLTTFHVVVRFWYAIEAGAIGPKPTCACQPV